MFSDRDSEFGVELFLHELLKSAIKKIRLKRVECLKSIVTECCIVEIIVIYFVCEYIVFLKYIILFNEAFEL